MSEDAIPRTATEFKVYRLNRGWSAARFAKEIGVTKRVIDYIEEGGKPSPPNALTIANYFRCQVTDIWPVDQEQEPATA